MTIVVSAAWVTMAAATLLASVSACTPGHRGAAPPTPKPTCVEQGATTYRPDAAEVERDRIYSLLAYAIVAKTWQSGEPKRGGNVGAILLDRSEKIACWAVDSVGAADDGTQHAETRLMTNYLQATSKTTLEGTTIYTTLEPCAMCGGMMVQQKVRRAMYGQTDAISGKALERLAFDASANGGQCPYPNAVQSVPATDPTRTALEQAFAASGDPDLRHWLASSAAEALYRDAVAKLEHFTVEHPENEAVLRRALAFYEGVPKRYVAAPYTVMCSARGR